jgi:uncharacterized membrane protein YhaH (DUF805 family)
MKLRRDFWIFVLAVFLVILANTLFGIYCVPFIWEGNLKFLVILNYILATFTLYAQIKTHLQDPGVMDFDVDYTQKL